MQLLLGRSTPMRVSVINLLLTALLRAEIAFSVILKNGEYISWKSSLLMVLMLQFSSVTIWRSVVEDDAVPRTEGVIALRENPKTSP